MCYCMYMATTQRSAPRYILGTVTEGRTYLYTGLGEFRSGLAAVEAWRSKPRSGPAYVFEERDVSRLGVTYGIDRKIVATA